MWLNLLKVMSEFKIFVITTRPRGCIPTSVLAFPECIYNPIMAMEFLAMFTFQLEVNNAGTPLP